MLIDLSHTIDIHTPSYPGDIPVTLTKTNNFVKDGFTNFQINSGMHIATHVDGLAHMTKDNSPIGKANLDIFYGQALILNYLNCKNIDINDELLNTNIDRSIVLIYTNFDKLWGTKEYFTDHPILTPEFANYLIKKRVKLIGIDFPSPDKDPYDIHKILLENGTFILENLTQLDLLVNHKKIKLMAFPLNISADSSPVRAVAQLEQ